MKIEVILPEVEKRFYCKKCNHHLFQISNHDREDMKCEGCGEVIVIADEMELIPAG